MTPSIYRIYKNPLYSGAIVKLTIEDGVSHGRVAYDPDSPHPGTGNEYDRLPPPVLGMDGNIYTLQATYLDGDYTIELVRWVVAWDGSEPSAGSIVATAVIGGQEPGFFNQTIGFLIPADNGVQAFFTPYTSSGVYTLALFPVEIPLVFDDCDMPNADSVIGFLPSGQMVIAATGVLT